MTLLAVYLQSKHAITIILWLTMAMTEETTEVFPTLPKVINHVEIVTSIYVLIAFCLFFFFSFISLTGVNNWQFSKYLFWKKKKKEKRKIPNVAAQHLWRMNTFSFCFFFLLIIFFFFFFSSVHIKKKWKNLHEVLKLIKTDTLTCWFN